MLCSAMAIIWGSGHISKRYITIDQMGHPSLFFGTEEGKITHKYIYPTNQKTGPHSNVYHWFDGPICR